MGRYDPYMSEIWRYLSLPIASCDLLFWPDMKNQGIITHESGEWSKFLES